MHYQQEPRLRPVNLRSHYLRNTRQVPVPIAGPGPSDVVLNMTRVAIALFRVTTRNNYQPVIHEIPFYKWLLFPSYS